MLFLANSSCRTWDKVFDVCVCVFVCVWFAKRPCEHDSYMHRIFVVTAWKSIDVQLYHKNKKQSSKNIPSQRESWNKTEKINVYTALLLQIFIMTTESENTRRYLHFSTIVSSEDGKVCSTKWSIRSTITLNLVQDILPGLSCIHLSFL